ncbi:hypothetical protein GPOL_c25780 [Gordonia polyisoprenivorans VH2]|uniref:Uncharacterized protein n=1 Tax=Gordonia polyisoprenivorans (strain DSM 44266 / VH2) TaxID=1112204 RepID=H6N4M3_GORPV|nr:hypothetical protein [Gordonia polyisoprenivorans]AFA73605.1 hypothetical protein GPOL_c25780 [Gordonia polyisoprenivorans VH2]
MGFLGGHFDGEMTSEGNGARVRAGVRDIPIIGDVDLVNVHVSPFRDGGQVGVDDRAARSTAKLAALHKERGESRTQRQERRATSGAARTAPAASGDRQGRQGGRDAPTRSGSSSAASESSSADSGHVPTGRTPSRKVITVGLARARHEIRPGVPCPSCAAGITRPVA